MNQHPSHPRCHSTWVSVCTELTPPMSAWRRETMVVSLAAVQPVPGTPSGFRKCPMVAGGQKDRPSESEEGQFTQASQRDPQRSAWVWGSVAPSFTQALPGVWHYKEVGITGSLALQGGWHYKEPGITAAHPGEKIKAFVPLKGATTALAAAECKTRSGRTDGNAGGVARGHP